VTARRRSLPPRFHRDLMQAITGDDPRAAEEAMRRHVQWGLETVLEVIGPPSEGDWRLKR